MNYTSPDIIKMESINLGELTPMELRCVESLEPLKANDLVVVMYITRVNQQNQIPLKIPYIIKSDKFQAYIDRFVEILTKEISTSSKNIENTNTDIVKVDTLPTEKPT